MMMAVGFAVGRQVNQLRMSPILIETLQQAVKKLFAAGQQSFKSDLAGQIAVVEENRDRLARRKFAKVSA